LYVGVTVRKEFDDREMAYKHWKSVNDGMNLAGKKILVVGGTAGIGEGIAIRYSQLGASVYIAGRNESSAENVISKMSKHDGQNYRFFKVDASSVKDLSCFTIEVKEFFSSKGGLDHLVQTQGILNEFGARIDTPEGLDQATMVNAYSRWKITKELAPLLHESSIYICNPVKSGSINFEDVEMKINRSWRGPGNRDGTFIDTITKEYQSLYPNQRFFHLSPGIVKTDVMKNTPAMYPIFRTLAPVITSIFYPIAQEPVSYADLPVYLATQKEEFKEGGLRLDDKMKPYADYDWIMNVDNRKKLWQWCENLESKFQ